MNVIFFAVVALSVGVGVVTMGPMSFHLVRIKQGGHSRRVITTLAFLTILLPALASAHGNVAMEEDTCVRRVEGNLIHFSAYQPQDDIKAQYCTEIPGEGDTFLVVDLVDPGLRNLPVGVRVVRRLNEVAEDQIVAYWPPTIHPDGVVRGEANLAKGLYKLIITPEGFSPSAYLLRVQQIDYSNVGRKAIGPLAILLLLALIGYEFSKSKRFRSWRFSGHS
jgi:hypothetical protein